MSLQLRTALERLDSSIDNLAQTAEETVKKRPKQTVQASTRNRSEVLARLDTVIERVESFLSAR